MFVLKMVKAHHVQFSWHPQFFHNFNWFNIKAAMAHHLIIQHVVDEVFAKGAIEKLTCGAAFYSNVFAVPKHSGGL